MGWMVLLVPVLLLGIGLLPQHLANRYCRELCLGLPWLVLAAAGTLLVATLALLAGERIESSIIYFDPLAATMSVLISVIGWTVVRFSVRYLEGDSNQGRFMRWMSFTLGAVLWMVMTSNLLVLMAMWVATSFGLHHLLTHYSERPAAVLAARKKFLVSRIGDFFLLMGLSLTYYSFGSFDLRDIFASVASGGTGATQWTGTLIGLCFVIGAMTKSAQFPMHSWLPDTMETPTPVSALMHAGIINAGGFLVIRVSPILAESPSALHLLAGVGALTAVFGAVVMLTQTSVKRSLAYSTIAQMGFMMLQCGLGAFSAALLHIVAHSLYKAHAFLSTGNVVKSASGAKTDHAEHGVLSSVLSLGIAGGAAWVLCIAVPQELGLIAASKPGALVLGCVLTAAITNLLWRSLATRQPGTMLFGLLAAGGIVSAYLAGFAAMSAILASTPVPQLSRTDFESVLAPIMLATFVFLLLLQAALPHWSQYRPMQAAYVHLSNGLYIDLAARQVVSWLWRTSHRPHPEVA